MSGKASEEITATKEEMEIGKRLFKEMDDIRVRLSEFSQGVLNRHFDKKGSQNEPFARAPLPKEEPIKECSGGICYCMTRNAAGEPTWKLC